MLVKYLYVFGKGMEHEEGTKSAGTVHQEADLVKQQHSLTNASASSNGDGLISIKAESLDVKALRVQLAILRGLKNKLQSLNNDMLDLGCTLGAGKHAVHADELSVLSEAALKFLVTVRTFISQYDRSSLDADEATAGLATIRKLIMAANIHVDGGRLKIKQLKPLLQV